ncbi:MAG: phosphatase PAP2 family protein [Rubrivivax sp.]|nr:phosphatase PAP2 family protein [Rubrivivax sp.]
MSAPPVAVRRAFALAAVRLSAWFALVFYGADAITAMHSLRLRVHAAWELAIPYWPAAYPLYLSVFALPFVVGWLAREPADVRRWESRMAAAIAVAGVAFVLLPAAPGYAPDDAGAWQPWATFTRWAAGRHNLVPSLHVALALITVRAAWPNAAPMLRAFLGAWLAALMASVLVTHQHHVADVVAGVLLGAWPWRAVSPPARGRSN